MNKSIFVGFLGLALCLVLIVGWLGSSQRNEQRKLMTLFEAVELAEREAQALNSGARLVKVISTDAIDPNDSQKTVETTVSGENGLRGTWNFTFTNCTLTISNGKVTNKQLDSSFIKWKPFSKKEVTLDSADAYHIALSEKKLRPGNPAVDWAIGYNYNLEYTSFTKHPSENLLILEVIGISPKGNFARVDIDAKTGKIILAEEKIYDDHENPTWIEF